MIFCFLSSPRQHSGVDQLPPRISSRKYSRGQELQRGDKWDNHLGRFTLNRSSGLISLIVLCTYFCRVIRICNLGQYFNLKNTNLSTNSVYQARTQQLFRIKIFLLVRSSLSMYYIFQYKSQILLLRTFPKYIFKSFFDI